MTKVIIDDEREGFSEKTFCDLGNGEFFYFTKPAGVPSRVGLCLKTTYASWTCFNSRRSQCVNEEINTQIVVEVNEVTITVSNTERITQ